MITPPVTQSYDPYRWWNEDLKKSHGSSVGKNRPGYCILNVTINGALCCENFPIQ